MLGEYPVFQGDAQIGKVSVYRIGLYYRFCCNCKLQNNGLYRLYVSCDGCQQNLGVLVPEGDCFFLETRVPSKRFGEGIPEFFVISNYAKSEEAFYPIYPEEPFAYISRLKDAYLIKRNSQLGVILK